MYDLLENFLFLFTSAKELVENTTNSESKRKVMGLVDLISQDFNNLRKSLPGFKEIELAVNTINSAISELSNDFPIGIGIFRFLLIFFFFFK